MSKHTPKPTTRVTVEEVAARLGISLSSAYRFVRKHATTHENGRFVLTSEWLTKHARALHVASKHPTRNTWPVIKAANDTVFGGGGVILGPSDEKYFIEQVPDGFVIRVVWDYPAAYGEKKSTVFSTYAEARARMALYILAEYGKHLSRPRPLGYNDHSYPALAGGVSCEFAALRAVVGAAWQAHVLPPASKEIIWAEVR